MNRTHTFAWVLLAVWATWLCAASGYLAQFTWLGNWTPQLLTAFFVAVAARAPASEIPKIAVALGIARVAVSIDSPAAVLAAALSCGAVLRIARSAIQLESPALAAAVAFVLTLLEAAWFGLVHSRTNAILAADWNEFEFAWRAGISTALATALFGGVLANLPGLGSLIRRKTWAVGASLR